MKRALAFIAIFIGFFYYQPVETDAMKSVDLFHRVVSDRPVIGRKLADDSRCALWADSVMRRMSLKEKIGQLLVYKLSPVTTAQNKQLMRKVIKDYKVGGLLFSGGSLVSHAQLTNEAQEMAHIPLLITLDGEWGLAMRLKPSPLFPRNRVLGCITNDSLIYEYGREVARECVEMGIAVDFAPVADIDNNPKNPVINTRSFGEDRQNVTNKVIAFSRGMEEGGVLAVAKHFPGHGDTDTDSHEALPTLPFGSERLDSLELYPFKHAINAGIDGIMVGHLNVPVLSGQNGLPSSLSRKVTTNLLEEQLGFSGLKFTDALEMKGVSSEKSVCLQALKAGNDVLLVPARLREEFDAIVNAVKNGSLSEEEVDKHCKKVLMYKYALGLYAKKKVQISGLEQRVNTPYASELVERLKKAAVTAFGNSDGTLPFSKNVKQIAVINVGGNQTAISSFVKSLSSYTKVTEIMLTASADAKMVKSKLKDFDNVIVCASCENLGSYKNVLSSVSDEKMVYVFFSSGKSVLPLQDCLRSAKAVIIAHDKQAVLQRHVADILFGKAIANGRISTSLGSLYSVGDGVDISKEMKETYPDLTFSKETVSRIDSIANEGIEKGAYPGCQIVVMMNGKVVIDKVYGHHTYTTDALPVKDIDVYDLASLSKTTGTLMAVMKLYDQTKINLSDYVSKYLPYLADTDKRRITIKDLLFHESGLPASILFYKEAVDEKSYVGHFLTSRRDRHHTVRIAASTWGATNFKYKEGLTSSQMTDKHTLQISSNLWIDKSFKEVYNEQIAAAKLHGRRYVYSDVNFILLQQIVEKVTGMTLDAFLEQEFYGPMGLQHTGYLPRKRLQPDDIVPTVDDKLLRKELLVGYVHDEAAAFQGGVSGNAGLFSNAKEVAKVYQMLLNGGEIDGKRYLSHATCQVFTTEVSKISRRGLGFDKPDKRNQANSNCAESAPKSVYGHTGFTGTCTWVDPEIGMVYVFLSNRVNPNPWNTKISSLLIRPRIQQVLYDGLKK